MNTHVDFSYKDVVIVKRTDLINFINKSSSNTDNPRYRFCMHDSPDNKLQEMFIVRKKGDYYRPDRHCDIPETHILVYGEEAVVLFDNQGNIINIIFLGGESDVFAYRINTRLYHMTVTLTDWAIDYEVKPGPFSSEINEFPDWAPPYGEQISIELFMRQIDQEIIKKKEYNSCK